MDITWQELARAAGRCSIDWERLDPEVQAAFLAHLQAIVPRWGGRYLREDEGFGPGLPEAAEILQFSELEARVTGDPKTPWREWVATRNRVRAALRPLARYDDPTDVDAPAAVHVARANQAAAHIDKSFDLYLFGVTNRNERASIREAIARAALNGWPAPIGWSGFSLSA